MFGMVEYKVGEWLGDVCVVWKSEGGLYIGGGTCIFTSTAVTGYVLATSLTVWMKLNLPICFMCTYCRFRRNVTKCNKSIGEVLRRGVYPPARQMLHHSSPSSQQ